MCATSLTTELPVAHTTSLVDLPPELLAAICAFVDCRSVVRSRLVCWLLRNVVDGSLELQYRIELVRDGMIDTGTRPPSFPSHFPSQSTTTPLTISDRLTRLRQLRKAWRTLNWTRCVTVPMPGPCCAYDLVGGIFCKTQPRVRRGRGRTGGAGTGVGVGAGGAGVGAGFGWNGWPVVMDGHALAVVGDGEMETLEGPHDFGSRTMSATWLPGRYDAGRTVVKDDLGIPTRDFAMDPSQDLMVLFKGDREGLGLPVVAVYPDALELHIRTLSTNQVHPKAGVPVLCTPLMYPVTSAFIQIVDDVVGMIYCVDPTRPRITIWNWKTGDLVVDHSNEHLPPGTWDFSFIHSRALSITTSNGGGSLELFTFTCDRADANFDSDYSYQTQLQPHRSFTPISSLNHIATLQLPPIHPSVWVLSISSHTGPFLASCLPDKPFVASNEERIHVLKIQYVHPLTLDGPRTRPKVCVFVHNRTLKRYLGSGVANAGGASTTPMVVPWREWGRLHARMLPHVGVFQWLRYVHGQRVVLLLPTSQAGKSTLQVLDFNVRSAFDDADADAADHTDRCTSEEMNDGNDDDTDSSLCQATLEHVTYPTRVIMPSIFIDVVESRLPYREARRDVRGDYSGVMIDDERLVGLKYPTILTGDMKGIDVFTM